MVLLVIVMVACSITGYTIYHQNQTIKSLDKQITAIQQTDAAQINGIKDGVDAQITALDNTFTSDQAATGNSIAGLQN